MDQKTKTRRVHDAVFAKYVKKGVFGKGAIALSFRWQEDPETPDRFQPVEIFRNIDAAEKYYTTHSITGDKVFCCYVITNLPFRQLAGPEAVVSGMEGANCKCYAAKPETLKDGPMTCKYNYLKIEGQKGGKVDVVPLDEKESTKEALEKRFGQFHFGWTSQPSLAETETTMETKPVQQTM